MFQQQITTDDEELEVADWIDSQLQEVAQSIGSKRSITLR